MADIHQVITLGIGTPSDITHFILVGLSANPFGVVAPTNLWDTPTERTGASPYEGTSVNAGTSAWGDPATRTGASPWDDVP
ncbi:MAG: hypothetical protein ACYC2H_01215 [Thermoplasmatota archaeon]